MIDSQYRVSFAQNREDVLLEGFFNKLDKGFYVDIGASDPEHLSVTKYFYDKGWSGINVEPIKRLHKKLLSARPRDINLNMGISDDEGEMRFREYAGDGLSTFSPEIQKDYQSHPNNATKKYKEYQVKTNSLAKIFSQNNVTKIDFMKVDVEGFEYSVLASNDWKKYRPSVICIEANHINKDWRPILHNAGYSLAFFDGINEYYVANEHKASEPVFSYEKTILDKPPVITPIINDAVAHYRSELDRHYIEVANLNDRLVSLDTELNNIHRLKPALKNFLHALDNFIVYLLEKIFNRVAEPPRRSEYSFDARKKTGKTDLLTETRLYDATFLYSDGPPRTTAFRIALYMYKLPIRFAKKIIKIFL